VNARIPNAATESNVEPFNRDGVLAEPGLILGRKLQQRARAPMGFTSSMRPTPSEAVDSGLIRYSGESHLLTFGSTGSGKTSGPAICNALTHPGQLIVMECKGDVMDATLARRQQMGQQVHVLDFRGENPGTGSFNPIDAVKLSGGGNSVIARSMAAAVISRRGDAREPFWENQAENLLAGMLSFVLDAEPPEKQNFSYLFDLLNADDLVYDLAVKLDSKGKTMHRSTHAAFANYIQLPERDTRPSVLASTQQYVMLWESELIRGLTENTSFDLQALVNGEPMTIYIVVPPIRMAAYAPVLRLWLTGLLSALMTRRKKLEHRTLMMCDELGTLGYVEAFVSASTLLRSFDTQLWSFWQNPAQLDIYKHHRRTIMDNAGVIQVLGVRNHLAAEEFATLFGGISADRIMAMRPDESLLVIDGAAPELARRIRYFDDPEFKNLYSMRR
jgi:type IV secretion system protein VirD4